MVWKNISIYKMLFIDVLNNFVAAAVQQNSANQLLLDKNGQIIIHKPGSFKMCPSHFSDNSFTSR